jgi:hypothetical protein
VSFLQQSLLCVVIVVVIYVAFWYVVNPKKAGEILKGLIVTLLVLPLALCLLSGLVTNLAGSFSLAMLLVLTSVIAYFIRQHRTRGDHKERRAPRPERTPVLPRGEEEE